jgi:hypothetical protein
MRWPGGFHPISVSALHSAAAIWCDRAFLATLVGKAPNVALAPVGVGQARVGAKIVWVLR